MRKINLNMLARDISKSEMGVIEVNIAQIKEVLHCAVWALANTYKPSEVLEMLERYEEEW